MLSCLIDVTCLLIFSLFMCYQTRWRKQTHRDNVRTACVVIASIVSLIDLARCFMAMKYPYVANLMRVVVVLSFFRGVRSAFFSLFGDFRDSFAILATIFSYILMFSFTVYYFYRAQFQGVINFPNLTEAYRQMTIMFTTANFPDLFLPAMRINFFNALLFVAFMLVGLYFLTNLLTANVFNKYMLRLQAKQGKRVAKRRQYIAAIFDLHDPAGKGFLDHMEGKQFLSVVLDLDYHQEYHRSTAARILSIIDVENRNRYSKEHVVKFFTLPRFVQVAGLESLNSLAAMANA